MPHWGHQSLTKLTQPEVNQITLKNTQRNRRYDIDFEREVVHVERPRPPSPDAQKQHRLACEARQERYKIAEDKGVVLGPVDWEPSPLTPTRKGVRWHNLDMIGRWRGIPPRRRRERPPRA